MTAKVAASENNLGVIDDSNRRNERSDNNQAYVATIRKYQQARMATWRQQHRNVTSGSMA